jgi:hypothetical protein
MDVKPAISTADAGNFCTVGTRLRTTSTAGAMANRTQQDSATGFDELLDQRLQWRKSLHRNPTRAAFIAPDSAIAGQENRRVLAECLSRQGTAEGERRILAVV